MEKVVVENEAGHLKMWSLSVVAGILALALGCGIFLITPDNLLPFTMWFAVFLVVNGLVELWFAMKNRSLISGSGTMQIIGGAEVILGLLLLFVSLSSNSFGYILGGWLFVRTTWITLKLFKYRKLNGTGIWLPMIAALGIILSLVFILMPVFGYPFNPIFAAAGLFLYAIARTYYGFKLRSEIF